MRTLGGIYKTVYFAVAYVAVCSALCADDRDIIISVLRSRQQCGSDDTKALIKRTVQSLAGGLNANALERLQLLHAACGAYLKQQSPEEYQQFVNPPSWATPDQWRAMIVEDRSFASIVQSLRANMVTPEKFCTIAGSLGRYLEQISAHDLVRSIICYLCEETFVRKKDYRAKAAVCSANFFDGIGSLLKAKDCEYIAEFGRALKTLPGPLKNRVLRTCEPYFLGITPRAEDVMHPRAWAAVSYTTPDSAYDRRHQLLLQNKEYKEALVSDDD